MFRTLLSFLVLLAFTATADAQGIARPIPKLIKTLSDDDYAVWAQWQNRQTERRAEQNEAESLIPRYNYANRIVSHGYMRGSAASSKSPFGYDNIGNNRTGSQLPFLQYSQKHGEVMTAYRTRYPNLDYIGSGLVTFYNPWARTDQGKGAPDWGDIFVPCKEGTITMQEVLDRLEGPQDTEEVFHIMLEGYFNVERQNNE